MSNKKENKEEEGIKAIAAALKAGGTLLNLACPICNSPLIKIDEKIYCKICNQEVYIYRDESELPKEYRQALKQKTKVSSEETEVEKTIKEKIEDLRKKLEKAIDPDEIVKLSEAINNLSQTLKKMKEE
ncbi:MAG: hypothetical protein KGD59_12305 [Candidatus Heimdallarchaeota archaeon]|nr:hypothetical protein [Candidatus Heimdallarchaeota archaeon]MBY8995326.1 hypothetical protein [Candidatus Heimdallarchaeota archaeon]